MKVSIIVPVYNAQERLRYCIDSIINQTYKNIEVVLVNDGSTDNSLEICKYYQRIDARIVVVDQENSGAGEARNTGLKKSKGEYILFVDADDTIEKNMVEILVSLMENNTSIDVVCCSYQKKIEGLSNVSKEQYQLKQDPLLSEDIPQCVLSMEKRRQFCYLWNKLFRRSIIVENHIRFQNRFITGQDLDFVLQYFYHVHKCILTDNAPYIYYTNGTNSLCSRYKNGLYEIVSELSEERMNMFKHLGLLEKEEGKETYQNSHIWYMHSCIPNMFRKNSGLTKKQKNGLMEQLYIDEKLKKYMPEFKPNNHIDKLFKYIYLHLKPTQAVTVYGILFCFRNNANRFYNIIRNLDSK